MVLACAMSNISLLHSGWSPGRNGLREEETFKQSGKTGLWGLPRALTSGIARQPTPTTNDEMRKRKREPLFMGFAPLRRNHLNRAEKLPQTALVAPYSCLLEVATISGPDFKNNWEQEAQYHPQTLLAK